ncbi:hypothetical protein [Pararhodobacter sp. CCB-MM2]|uniref:hypothetical protein n=1 Tax=Pararhodobacter sp. CCB-MM2 TaxID=1786003 RepID=UPI0008332118|nr:hypothetical protein [Pararhodobacter sp. CCB-MM2]MCA2012590.1 hypothetical protein [Cereibacter sphaeroides]
MAAADIAFTASRRTRKPFVYSLPIIGGIAREWTEGDADFPLYLIVALVSIWGISIVTWGLPALFLPAVFFSPVMLFILVMISRG